MQNLRKVFGTSKPIIGALHLMPLLGYDDYQHVCTILQKALLDLKAFEKGGVNGIIVENNYDIPHTITVGSETVICMTYIVSELIKKTKLPIGISVLWNDYKAALAIAKVCGGKFIRVPVFVDDVRTRYGDVFGNAKDVLTYRKKINAQDVLLFTDIHVKHAVLLSKKTLVQSAKEAMRKGSDALIVTGKWTADAPNMQDIQQVRKVVEDFPMFIGSGATKENIQLLLQYANGAIVGTSLKTGKQKQAEVNVKTFHEQVDMNKVKIFMQAVKG